MVDFTLDAETERVRDRAREFVRGEVLPREEAMIDDEQDRLDMKALADLQQRARDADLWVPHMPKEWGGLGLDAVGMAVLHEELGYAPIAPLALNCMAPDEGNMHTLLEFGTDDQKERYLRPLVDGDIRSCFAMTEPDGAGADATDVQTTATKDGDEWVLDGRKWFVTGADAAEFAIVVAATDPDADDHARCSLLLVPTDADGFEIVRRIPVMGSPAPGGHCEIELDGVRVPDEDLLGARQAGFAIAQERLGGGRIAHAMRWIGMAQRALDLAAKRAEDRETFGKPLSKRQAVQWKLADSAKDLYASRLMVLNAAWKIAEGLDHRQEISMLKVFVANALHRVVDRAIQIHGGQGVSGDTPLARFYQDARSARIYDGPDEVHQYVIARNVLRAMADVGGTRRAAEVVPSD